MNRINAQQRVRQARRECEHAEAELATSWPPWRKRLMQHPLAVLIGSGLLTGCAVAALPPRHWSRLGAALFGGSAWLARSPLGPVLFGTLLAQLLEQPRTAKLDE